MGVIGSYFPLGMTEVGITQVNAAQNGDPAVSHWTQQDPDNYLPMELINTTGLPDDQVYVFIKAATLEDGADCVMALQQNSAQLVAQRVSPGMDPSRFCYKLSQLPKFADRSFLVYIPQSQSGRIYFSVGRPLKLKVDERTNRICDPDGFNQRDENYFTLYDKIEYSYNKAGNWTNTTAVDFFCLPIRISQSGSVEIKASGFNKPREVVLDAIWQTFVQNARSPEWGKLFLNFTGSDGRFTTLRVIAPGKAMVPGMPGAFNHKYLHGADGQFHYTNFLWDYYRTNTVVIDASELKGVLAVGRRTPDDYLFIGQVEGDDFVFTNKTRTFQERIRKPATSIPFFAGAQDSFAAANKTVRAIIVRQLTAAFDVGFLPASNGVLLSKDLFKRYKRSFYQQHPLFPAGTGPWYDLYSKGLHDAADGEDVYTFAYDDAAGQDGTLHDPNGRRPSTLRVVLGDLSGTIIPQPEKDSTRYTVKFNLPPRIQILYNGQWVGNGASLQNAPMPLQLKVNGKDVSISVNPVLVKAASGPAEGIVVNRQGANVTLTFPASF